MNPSSFVVRCFSVLLLLTHFACGGKKTEEGILSHEQMVKVLSEIYIVEDKVNRLSLSPDSGQVVFDMMKEKISSKTGIPESSVKKSLEYYAARPKEMEQIYAALVDSLNLNEQRAQE